MECVEESENIREASKFSEGEKSEQIEENIDTAMIMKLKLEQTLQKLVEMIGEIETQELAITIEDFDKCQYDTEDKLSELEVFITYHKEKQKSIIEQQEKRMKMELREKEEKLEMEQREKEKKPEMEQGEKEKKMKTEVRETEKRMKIKIEKEKIRINEKIQLEKISLEQLQIETDAKKQAEKIEAEVKLKEIDAANSTKELEKLNMKQSARKWEPYSPTSHWLKIIQPCPSLAQSDYQSLNQKNLEVKF